MIELGSPYTKAEMTEALAAEVEAVHTFFSEIDEDKFFAAPENVWTAADNLVHLIQSCSPVILALKVPKTVLRVRFGKAKRPSRTLADVRDASVNEALAGGGEASGQFLPEVEEPSPAERERVLAKWLSKGNEFPKAIADWSEEDLDKYVLPHPLLGKMTVREILLFTLYHNMHHVNDVQRLLNLPVSEWFMQTVEE